MMDAIKNPNCRKVRGSHVLEVACAKCKTFIANYQKVGESNFVKMYNDRIIDGYPDSVSQLDYCFASPNLKIISGVVIEIPEVIKLSDHNPLMIEFDM